ncbi:hypothetical protein L798_00690 [Zootermopsis nevadensis]|uniref:Uncharacterized protein n=1 Tax=Zootermopsis nevadensis TaxID=136037 RepID=A0A067QL37_ZOONE|nr:hypothetical protein L798_00690 [Zootermopsis nevadensis]
MLMTPQLQECVVICPKSLISDAQRFVSSLIRAAQGVRFVIPQPYLRVALTLTFHIHWKSEICVLLQLNACSPKVGIDNVVQQKSHDVTNERPSSFVEALKEVISRTEPQLLMCIVADGRLCCNQEKVLCGRRA